MARSFLLTCTCTGCDFHLTRAAAPRRRWDRRGALSRILNTGSCIEEEGRSAAYLVGLERVWHHWLS